MRHDGSLGDQRPMRRSCAGVRKNSSAPADRGGKLAAAGVGTIVGMHMGEDHRKRAKEEKISVVIAGLSAEVESARKECAVIAQRLSSKRHDVCRRIEQSRRRLPGHRPRRQRSGQRQPARQRQPGKL